MALTPVPLVSRVQGRRGAAEPGRGRAGFGRGRKEKAGHS